MNDVEPLGHVRYVGAMDASTTPVAVIFVAPCRCRVTGIGLVDSTTKAGHGTNYGTYAVTNRGAAGTGTTAVASRTTITPTTDDITAYVYWPLTLSTTKANLDLAAGDVLLVTATEAGAAASGDLVLANWIVKYVPGYSSV